jgi:hypothetical protein
VSDEEKRQRRERREVAFTVVDALQKQWLSQLRRQGRPVDAIVDEIRRHFRKSRGDERWWLAGTLVSFLILAKREAETVQVVDAMIDELPDEVHFPMRKAFLYHYILDDPGNALPCIEIALERAYRSGLSRREALGVKARILLALGRGKELSDVLEQIMAMQMIKGVADIGRERDFVDRAPAGLISEDVLRRYNEFRPKRASDGTEDMPPEWEPPEWE